MKLTIPTWLTLFRIALIPVLVATFYLDYKGTNHRRRDVRAVAPSPTGWTAGSRVATDSMSAFGAFLDPVADKLMVTVTLFLIVQADPSTLMAHRGPVIVGREIAVSALREWMAELGERKHVRVATIGKIKTIVQMVAITFLLWREPILGFDIYAIGQWLLFAAAFLTIWSAAIYMRAAWPVIRARED
jgi:CDP-diacylglycerol--glycerol-3-phosphate 3-phosphatidyltransferase